MRKQFVSGEKKRERKTNPCYCLSLHFSGYAAMTEVNVIIPACQWRPSAVSC